MTTPREAGNRLAAAKSQDAAGSSGARVAARAAVADRGTGARFDHRQPVLDGGGARAERGGGGGAVVHHQLPHRGRPGIGPSAIADRPAAPQGFVGAAQPNSFRTDRCATAAPAVGAGRAAGEHRPRSQGRARFRAQRRQGRAGAAAADHPAGRITAAGRCDDRAARRPRARCWRVGSRRGCGMRR